MILVLAEAVRNSKNAAVQIYKIKNRAYPLFFYMTENAAFNSL